MNLKPYLKCLKDILCSECSKELYCLLKAVEIIPPNNSRRIKPEKEVVRY